MAVVDDYCIVLVHKLTVSIQYGIEGQDSLLTRLMHVRLVAHIETCTSRTITSLRCSNHESVARAGPWGSRAEGLLW